MSYVSRVRRYVGMPKRIHWTPVHDYRLEPGDIVFMTSDSIIAWLIRWVERRRRIRRGAYVNHVMLVVTEGTLATARMVDAQPPKVREHTITRYRGELAAIYRPIGLNWSERNTLVREARLYVGRWYGVGKIVLHLLGLQHLAFIDRWPICSWSVAMPFSKLKRNFGVAASAAQPEEMFDFVRRNGSTYGCIMPLGIIE